MSVELGKMIATFFPGNLTPEQKKKINAHPRVVPLAKRPVAFRTHEAGLVCDVDSGKLVLLWRDNEWVVVDEREKASS